MNPKTLKNTFIFGGLMWFLILACIFALSSLACVQPATTRIVPAFGMTPIPTPPPLEMVVQVGKLYIRNAPNGDVVSYRLEGDTLPVTHVEVVGDFRWCQVGDELWAACQYLEAK